MDEGLTEPRALSLERFPVRTRERRVAHSGWRLAIASVQGEGANVLVEVSAGGPARSSS